MTGEALDPLNRFALSGADLHAPGRVDVESDLRRAQFDEMIEHVGLAAEHIAAVAMNADADAEFVGKFLRLLDRLRESGDLKVDGDVLRAGQRRALEYVAFLLGAGEGLDAKGDDADAGIGVGLHHVLERGWVLEVGVDAANFNFIEADLTDFFGHIGVILKLAETETLDSEI